MQITFPPNHIAQLLKIWANHGGVLALLYKIKASPRYCVLI